MLMMCVGTYLDYLNYVSDVFYAVSCCVPSICMVIIL